jgi:hypothetical protein
VPSSLPSGHKQFPRRDQDSPSSATASNTNHKPKESPQLYVANHLHDIWFCNVDDPSRGKHHRHDAESGYEIE